MKYTLLMAFASICLTYCSNPPAGKAASSVNDYLKKHLRKPESYQPVSFSSLDTLKSIDSTGEGETSLYKIKHSYSVNNSDDDKIQLTVSFYLDKDLNVIRTDTKSINGDYGKLQGNAIWTYNDYVGNKPDDGATIELYGLDSAIKYKIIADTGGNYTIKKILPGRYFLFVHSENVTDCPEEHLRRLLVYADTIKKIFDFDIHNQNQFSINTDSIYRSILSDTSGSKQIRSTAEKLLMLLPDDFKKKIQLNTAYSNAVDFSVIIIEENETKTVVTSFGYTCI